MPTSDQLSHLSVTDGDGSTVTNNDDGTTTTDWPDGTQRVDYTDGSVMVTFPDKSVLNMYADGSKTLNDVNGTALDPATGAPLNAQPEPGPTPTPPEQGPDKLLRLLGGDESITDLDTAKSLFETFKDTLKGEIDPVEWVKQWIKMVLQVVKALETEERGCYYRGWCYAVLYGALDMGAVPSPTFANSLQGPDQDSLDKTNWDEGVSAANGQLADGKNGVSLRNRVLLRVAKNGDPAAVLKEMYVAACDNTDDKDLKRAYADILGWPTPTGA
jgi:hypothetical protein